MSAHLRAYRTSLDPDDEMQLQNEVDILAQLDHPNVVKQYEIFDERDCIYLVLELMTGGEVNKELSLNDLAFRPYC